MTRYALDLELTMAEQSDSTFYQRRVSIVELDIQYIHLSRYFQILFCARQIFLDLSVAEIESLKKFILVIHQTSFIAFL